MAEPRGTGRVTFLVNAAGNFLGAAVAFLYFRLVDQHAATLPRVSLHELVHPLLVFAALLALGNWLNNRWVAPINRATQGHPLSEREAALVRRRALLFPYVLAGVSFAGWVVAGLVWGFGMPLMMGRDVSLSDGVRIVFGITVLAGTVTTAFIFFVSERIWRTRLLLLFPEGDLSAVRRVPRLAVRVRLLAIFLLTALVPLAVLGILSYTPALHLLDPDPATPPGVEAPAPRDVVRDLNEYFPEMAEAIRAQRGLVLQFIGDEIEAVFGAPIASRDHAAMAVRAALDMRGRLRAWNARREAAGKPALRDGIGIHTGTVLAGNIGGAERLSYALVGDPVNLASRIQGLTKAFKGAILISEATRKSLDPAVPLEELPAVRVKGRAEEVNVYKVV